LDSLDLDLFAVGPAGENRVGGRGGGEAGVDDPGVWLDVGPLQIGLQALRFQDRGGFRQGL